MSDEYIACFACQPKDAVACRFTLHDECALRGILKALPSASDEQIEAALKELTRKPNSEVCCEECERDRPDHLEICLSHCPNGEMFLEREKGGE